MESGRSDNDTGSTDRAGDFVGTQTRKLLAAAIAAYALGIVWRIYYIFVGHPATDYIYSDMFGYVERAKRFIDPNGVYSIADTIQSPGAHIYFAGLYAIDSSWLTAFLVQFLLSAMVPPIIGMIGFELFGLEIALLSSIMASLYFPFIDYAGYFMAENPYLFAMVLAMLMLIRSLKSKTRWHSMVLAVVAGLALGSAVALKSVALLPGLLIAVYLETFAWKYRIRKILPVIVAVSIGILVFLIPLGERCYRLSENSFCLVDNNYGHSFLMGHYGHFRSARWVDNQRGMVHIFGTPVAAQRAYQDEITFNFGAYDANKALATAWQWIKGHPLETLLLSIEHVFDLFEGTVPWPSSATRFGGLTNLYQQIYLVFILLPACVYVWSNVGSLLRMQASSMGEALLLLPTLGLMVAALLTVGEPRFRIPFDGFTIILAARVYLGGRSVPRLALAEHEHPSEH